MLSAIIQVLWLWRSPWKVRPGLPLDRQGFRNQPPRRDRQHRDVTVIEADLVGAGASHGNAAKIALATPDPAVHRLEGRRFRAWWTQL